MTTIVPRGATRDEIVGPHGVVVRFLGGDYLSRPVFSIMRGPTPQKLFEQSMVLHESSCTRVDLRRMTYACSLSSLLVAGAVRLLASSNDREQFHVREALNASTAYVDLFFDSEEHVVYCSMVFVLRLAQYRNGPDLEPQTGYALARVLVPYPDEPQMWMVVGRKRKRGRRYAHLPLRSFDGVSPVWRREHLLWTERVAASRAVYEKRELPMREASGMHTLLYELIPKLMSDDEMLRTMQRRHA